MKNTAALLLMGLTLLSGVAHAKPVRLVDPPAAEYTRTGAPQHHCACRVLDANTTTFPMAYTQYQSTGAGSGPRPICYGWGTQITITSSDEATACLTLSTTVSMGSQATIARTYVDDQGTTLQSDGDGACTTFGGAGTWTIWPSYEVMFGSTTSTTVGGYRSSICRNTTDGSRQRPLFAPDDRRIPFCAAAGDCTEAGVSAGTCSAIDTETERTDARLAGCAFLVMKALNASTEVCACVER